MKIHEDIFIEFHLCEWKELRETKNWLIHNKNQEKEKVNFVAYYNNWGDQSKRWIIYLMPCTLVRLLVSCE